MKTFALALLLASPALAAAQSAPKGVAVSTAVVQTPRPAGLESSKVRLDAQDAAGALADAETALAHGGGADAYAARADAKRALGRPVEEVIADYAEAAKLNPSYIEKYQGLIAQENSEEHPGKKPRGTGPKGVPLAGLLAAVSIGGLCLGIAVTMLSARKSEAEKPEPADLEQAPGKEPPKT
jgi:hypothetical protein